MKTRARFMLSWLFAFPALSGRAQLFVDYGGPRNIFAESLAGEEGKAPRFGTIDTKEKSLMLNFFGLPHQDAVVFGGSAKVIAQDDLSELLSFSKAPKLEANVLANYTPAMGRNGTLWSATLRVAASQASYSLQDPATKKVASDRFQTAEVYLTLACSFRALGDGNGGNNNTALALTVGYKPDTNYEALPQVDLGDGKTARVGTLERFKTYPLQLIVVREVYLNKPAWMNYLPRVEEEAEKFLLFSPYAKITPRAGGAAGRAFGLNLTLKTKLRKEGEPLSKTKYAFPYSIYVETSRPSGADHGTTAAGVSTIFAF